MLRHLGCGFLLAVVMLSSEGAEEARPNPNGLSGPTSTNLVITQLSADEIQIGEIKVNRLSRTLEFPAFVNMTEGLMEYFLVTTYGKVHESVLITEARPYAIHAAALLLSPKGAPTSKAPATVELSLIWESDGRTNEVPAAACIMNTQAKMEMNPGPWSYTGSQMVDGVYLAEREGSIISVIEDQAAIFQNPRKGKENDEIWQPNAKKLPPADTKMTVRIKFQQSSKKDEKHKTK